MPMGLLAPRLESRPLMVSVAGVAGVLLIHLLLVLPFVLSHSLPSPRLPNTTGAGASALVSSAEPEMTVVFIDEPTPAESTAPKAPVLASRGMTPPDLQLVVLSPDPSPAASPKTEDSDANQSDAEAAEAVDHARLYGRYVGQVQARIERAWTRPRSQIGAPQFSCRTRIHQDRRGEVIGVSLDHCNGTERWQQSLRSAIRTASPLPAPPDSSVYADVLWLSFSSEDFKEGGSTQGFEPETRAAGAERGALESFQRFATGSHDDNKSAEKAANVIHLTITGRSADHSDRIEVAPTPPLEAQPTDPAPQ